MKSCLASLRDHPPDGAGWVHEIKYDRYRAQLQVFDGRAKAYTRRGYDWSRRFISIVKAALEPPVTSAILHGEIVVTGERGISDYGKLQDDLAIGRYDRLVYYAFDLLDLDGTDLPDWPLIKRKGRLARLLGGPGSSPIIYSEHLEAPSELMYRRACDMGLEGLVSKQWRTVSLRAPSELDQAQVHKERQLCDRRLC